MGFFFPLREAQAPHFLLCFLAAPRPFFLWQKFPIEVHGIFWALYLQHILFNSVIFLIVT